MQGPLACLFLVFIQRVPLVSQSSKRAISADFRTHSDSNSSQQLIVERGIDAKQTPIHTRRHNLFLTKPITALYTQGMRMRRVNWRALTACVLARHVVCKRARGAIFTRKNTTTDRIRTYECEHSTTLTYPLRPLGHSGLAISLLLTIISHFCMSSPIGIEAKYSQGVQYMELNLTP